MERSELFLCPACSCTQDGAVHYHRKHGAMVVAFTVNVRAAWITHLSGCRHPALLSVVVFGVMKPGHQPLYKPKTAQAAVPVDRVLGSN